jgi:hypothetical protein
MSGPTAPSSWFRIPARCVPFELLKRELIICANGGVSLDLNASDRPPAKWDCGAASATLEKSCSTVAGGAVAEAPRYCSNIPNKSLNGIASPSGRNF